MPPAGKPLLGSQTMAISCAALAASCGTICKAAQRVNRLRALLDQQLTDPEYQRSPLGIITLHGHETHLLARIASALAASFFRLLTNGLVQAGLICRTSWPSFPYSLSQKWNRPQLHVQRQMP